MEILKLRKSVIKIKNSEVLNGRYELVKKELANLKTDK